MKTVKCASDYLKNDFGNFIITMEIKCNKFEIFIKYQQYFGVVIKLFNKLLSLCHCFSKTIIN